MTTPLPRWADLVLLPAVCLGVALLVAAAVVALVGQSPAVVMTALVQGAFGTLRGLSYTLYYATTFIFTGLAVAVAFHGGLFNIGGEGQAVMGGLGTGLAALYLSASLPAWAMLPLMLLAGMLFGMLWAAVPAYLQAYRGSHVVITTIMFNFIASSILVYLLVNHLRPKGVMAIESKVFAASATLPSAQSALAWIGVEWPASPLNLSLLLALLACCAVYLFLWRSRAGYRLRAVGVRRHPFQAPDPGCHGRLGRAGRHGGYERDCRRERQADSGVCGRCRLYRHCRSADGAQPPGRHCVCQRAVWCLVPGRGRGVV
jgi:general nucleoside transport system permease protein